MNEIKQNDSTNFDDMILIFNIMKNIPNYLNKIKSNLKDENSHWDIDLIKIFDKYQKYEELYQLLEFFINDVNLDLFVRASEETLSDRTKLMISNGIAQIEFNKILNEYNYMVVENVLRTSTLNDEPKSPIYAKSCEQAYNFITQGIKSFDNVEEEGHFKDLYYVNSLEKAIETNKIMRTPDHFIVYEYKLFNSGLKNEIETLDEYNKNKAYYIKPLVGEFNIRIFSYCLHNDIIMDFKIKDSQFIASIVNIDDNYKIIIQPKESKAFSRMKPNNKNSISSVKDYFLQNEFKKFNIDYEIVIKIIQSHNKYNDSLDKVTNKYFEKYHSHVQTDDGYHYHLIIEKV